jgi:hypothetical protein
MLSSFVTATDITISEPAIEPSSQSAQTAMRLMRDLAVPRRSAETCPSMGDRRRVLHIGSAAGLAKAQVVAIRI